MMRQDQIAFEGHSIQARLNAEDPWNGFLPSAGKLLRLDLCDDVRVDAGLKDRVSASYDSLMAKLISHTGTRADAIDALIDALMSSSVLGIYTNQAFLIQLLQSEMFQDGATFTSSIDDMQIGSRPVPDELVMSAAILANGPRRESDPVWLTPAGGRV
jgi:acetyl/propionyl-CoA carboxylase alpha subunit